MIHKDIESLQPDVQIKVRAFLTALDEASIKYCIIETFREREIQAAYYAQGRRNLSVVNSLRHFSGLCPISADDNTHTVTNCDGSKSKSKHQYGRAIDIAPLKDNGNPNWNATKEEWEAIGLISEANGLTWGGRFGQKSAATLGWDCPHHEC